MARPFPEKYDGSTLEPMDLNWAYQFLRRMRKMRGDQGISVHETESSGTPFLTLDRTEVMHAQLTGPWDATNLGYPWQEVLVRDGRMIALSGYTGTPAGGDPAFERRKNDMTLTADGTVYLFRRSPASGQWVFPHRAVGGYRICVTIQDCNLDSDPHVTSITITGPGGFSTTFDPGMLISHSYFCIDVPGTGTYTVTVTSSVYPTTVITVVVSHTGATYASMCMGGYGPICSFVTSCGGPVDAVTVQWQCGATDLGTSTSFFVTETNCRNPDGSPAPSARIARVCSPCRPTACTLVGTVTAAPTGFATGQTASFPPPTIPCAGMDDWACNHYSGGGTTPPVGFILGPAVGYGELCCIYTDCPGMTGAGQPILIPILDPLHLTDPWWGSTVLHYGTYSGVTGWLGTLSVTCSEPGCPPPQPRTFTMSYFLNSSTCLLTVGCHGDESGLGFFCPDDAGITGTGRNFQVFTDSCPPAWTAHTVEFGHDEACYTCVNPAAIAAPITLSQ